MFTIIFLAFTILYILIHIALTRSKRTFDKVLEIILLDYIVIGIGIGQTIAGLEHILNGPAIAKGIGWAAGSPFQLEVGATNIAIGIAALFGGYFRESYWLSIAIIGGIFELGAGMIHICDLFSRGNAAAYNAGPFLYINDMILPIALFVLVVIYLREQGRG